ncbi:MAG TPA: hypothetical protein VHO70_18350 [Chitinispirillaceae bacterium]|nr:hypothetical protein [Chitinispirillaceae bacterium]
MLHTDITILEILEIQYSRELDYLQRILFGTSKAIIEHMAESSATLM